MMNLFENLQLMESNSDNNENISLNDIYKIMNNHDILKYVSDFRYNRDLETITFKVTTGSSLIDGYPVGDYTISDDGNKVSVHFIRDNDRNSIRDFEYSIEEFDNRMQGLYLFCSRFYG